MRASGISLITVELIMYRHMVVAGTAAGDELPLFLLVTKELLRWSSGLLHSSLLRPLSLTHPNDQRGRAFGYLRTAVQKNHRFA